MYFNPYPYGYEEEQMRIFPGFPSQGFPTGFPSQGFQPGFPSQPPGFGPGQGGSPGFSGGGGQDGPPSSPPPSFTPQMQQQQFSSSGGPSVFAVDPGAIRGCRFRFTYVWLDNGNSFWFYPTFVGRTSVAGWRWRRNRWTYYGTDLRRISSFRCF
ncbi:hypothetical protein ACQCT6_07455 [Cytobacillus gottheilii]|uniref:hypothetical protein n=1 Tax=Cytobacillus gottheilii TaxID=859144 RepID=UPI00082B90B0|nr:hypothetical protein [Cytobacillus gottheilii]